MKDMVKISVIYDHPLIEDNNTVCYTRNGVEIMRNKNHCSLCFFFDTNQLIQNFKLRNGVNRSSGLICHKQGGLHRGGDADHDTLENTAGKLVGVFFQDFLRISNLHFLQQLQRTGVDFL